MLNVQILLWVQQFVENRPEPLIQSADSVSVLFFGPDERRLEKHTAWSDTAVGR